MRQDELSVGPGDVIGRAYRVLRVLSRTDRTVVVEAQHQDSGERAVLKLIRSGRQTGRLLQAAESFVTVEHAHVVRLLSFGEDDGVAFLVMPFVEGTSLWESIVERAASVEETLTIGASLLDGTAAAHRAGVLHHALTPDKILLHGSGDGPRVPHILGFVGAKSLSWGGETLGVQLLAPMASLYPFLAPELLLGGTPADARADVYSLGAIVSLLLTGKAPYSAQNPVDLVLQIRRAEAPRVDRDRTDVPRALADIVARALARAPEARFASVEQMQAAWSKLSAPSSRRPLAEKVAQSESTPHGARRPVVTTRAVDWPALHVEDADDLPLVRASQRGHGLVVLGVLSALMLVGATWFARSGRTRPAESALVSAHVPRAVVPVASPGLVAQHQDTPPVVPAANDAPRPASDGDDWESSAPPPSKKSRSAPAPAAAPVPAMPSRLRADDF